MRLRLNPCYNGMRWEFMLFVVVGGVLGVLILVIME